MHLPSPPITGLFPLERPHLPHPHRRLIPNAAIKGQLGQQQHLLAGVEKAGPPLHHQLDEASQRKEQLSQQMTHFGNGERHQICGRSSCLLPSQQVSGGQSHPSLLEDPPPKIPAKPFLYWGRSGKRSNSGKVISEKRLSVPYRRACHGQDTFFAGFIDQDPHGKSIFFLGVSSSATLWSIKS